MIPIGGSPLDLHARARGYKTVAVIVVAAFVLLAARLWHLQVLRGESYYRKTADNFVKEIDLPASRGEIRDRAGHVLGENRPSYNVYLTPRFVTDDGLGRLARHLRLSEDQVATMKARAATKTGLERNRQVLAVEDISRDQMALIESDKAQLPGVAIDARSHRAYPFGKNAAHIIGYMNEISAEELSTLREQGYHIGDYVGRAGIERQWESYLRGKDGFQRVVIDAKGRQKNDADLGGPLEVQQIIGGPLRMEPVPGANVILAIDLDLQRMTERALGRYPSAAAVAVEVKTGRVLAAASHPGFDPNVLTGRLSRAEDERMLTSPLRPMIDKAVREMYFPGSTFKIIPALVALQDKQVDPNEKMLCTSAYKMPGHTFHCMEVHGRINLHTAIAESCNIFFYHLGERIGMDRMADLATQFGFGVPTGVGLPGEAAGFIPTQEWYKKQGGFLIGYTLNTAIGQGSTKATVLQMALAYAALANGGDLWVPQLVDRIETPSGRVVQQFEPRLRRHIPLVPDNVERVKSALCDVVNVEKGTAWVSKDDDLPFEVCGKTGTAQVKKTRKGQAPESTGGWEPDKAHSWFAAYAPARDPEIAVVVLVEHGGLGGHVAAPIAMEIFRAYLVKGAGRPRAETGAQAGVQAAAGATDSATGQPPTPAAIKAQAQAREAAREAERRASPPAVRVLR